MDSILKQNIIIVIAIALLSTFSDCGYCPVSAPTVSVVSKCPTTKTEWEEAANRKKCTFMSASTNCGDKMPVYHCLLNQWKNETVEVCASTWYISGFCAIYNSDEMKVIDDFNRDCTNFTDASCPTRYISTDAYMYQRCYEKQDTRTSIPSTDKHHQVPTVCTLPVAFVVILSILLIILLVLLLLTCLGKIPKPCNIGKIKMDTQRMRSCKNTADEESGNRETRPETPDSEGQDGDLHGEETINEKNALLPNDQKPTNERNGDNNTSLSFKERQRIFDAGHTIKATITKDEDPNKESLEEGKAIIDGQTDSLNDDEKFECNVEDAGDTIKATITKDEDPNKESLEKGKAITDERTDFHTGDQAAESNVGDLKEGDRLHENVLRVMDTQLLQSNEISDDEEERDNENKPDSQKDIDSSSSSSSSKSQNETSSENEDQSDPKDRPIIVKEIVKNINKISETK